MKAPAPEIIEIDAAQFEELKQRAAAVLAEEDYSKICSVLDSYRHMLQLIENKSTTIARLRKLLFGASTERTADVVGRESDSPAAEQPGAAPSTSDAETPPLTGQEPRAKKPGHGRNAADRYARRQPSEGPSCVAQAVSGGRDERHYGGQRSSPRRTRAGGSCAPARGRACAG